MNNLYAPGCSWCLLSTLLLSATGCCPSPAKVEDLGSGYTRMGNRLFVEGQLIGGDVDPSSFIVLNEIYTKDKRKVYYRQISAGSFRLTDLFRAHPGTFEVLEGDLSRDANHVWYSDKLVPGANPATVSVIKRTYVWMDDRRVFYQGEAIVGADPKTFRSLNEHFYCDAKHVYWGPEVLHGADPESFCCFDNFGVDKNQAWSADNILDGVDPATFVLLYNGVYKDSRQVYCYGLPVQRANATEFSKVSDLQYGNALFKDDQRYFVYDTHYNEIYTLEKTGDSVLISKPVWLEERTKQPPVRGATVSVTLTGDSMSEPQLVMQPEHRHLDPPEHEKNKIMDLKPTFLQLRERLWK